MRLRGAAGDDSLVFPSPKSGRALSRAQVWRIVRTAARRAGLTSNISPNWFRHPHKLRVMHRKEREIRRCDLFRHLGLDLGSSQQCNQL
jgi:hypothetical protein